jgi:hypothetical protein
MKTRPEVDEDDFVFESGDERLLALVVDQVVARGRGEERVQGLVGVGNKLKEEGRKEQRRMRDG